ncbi:MAG TPA: FKBP-type peptidyl-prolyl cis-trans isomerase N-terminal domain-containing protein [Terriglobales bacterium]|jgi:FKBP-type peptidyl-prolyl cis-trans isomerase|nr:FKBP-type peptidyl-prolyl cis-trans isomerase N-terminal domain-containing protein [Terriglobales bacterium]
MLKLLSLGTTLLATGAMLVGSAVAQQSTSSQTSAAKPAGAQSQQAAPSGQAAPAKPATGAQSTTAPANSAMDAALPTQKDKLSYAIGMNIGKGLHKDSIDVDPNMIMRGLKDGMAGGTTLMTDEQAQAAITELRTQMMAKMAAEHQKEAEANKKEGEAFLAANKTKPGVVTLPSGLQYKVLKDGTGPKPAATDQVKCNYRGTLVNGTEFDSSAKHGEPITFPVNGVIKGWTEALQLMPVGSKWQLYVPADLAYGERGAGDVIPPNSTLIFDVELLAIEKPQAPAAPATPSGAAAAPKQ